MSKPELLDELIRRCNDTDCKDRIDGRRLVAWVEGRPPEADLGFLPVESSQLNGVIRLYFQGKITEESLASFLATDQALPSGFEAPQARSGAFNPG